MIVPRSITWRPIASMPEDRKDGRTMLLWSSDAAALGQWAVNPPGRPNGWQGWEDPEQWHEIAEVTHWEDIDPPE
ncbi:hypothetical protein EIK56_25235 [Sphingomonas sp. C8-2]|nr:hypothetical protein EIK56_25235 [Sphingomonas sp. C8-2]